MSWKKLATSTLLSHPRLTVKEDDVELPNGHKTKYIYFDKSYGAVTIIAVRDDKVLLQQEYSYPPNEVMYQFPGGGLKEDETPEIGGQRELQEESGYQGSPHYLGCYYPDNRRSKAKMHVVFMDNVVGCAKEGGDIEETIISQWVSFPTLYSMIEKGKIVNYSILAGMSLFEAYLRRLDKLET